MRNLAFAITSLSLAACTAAQEPAMTQPAPTAPTATRDPMLAGFAGPTPGLPVHTGDVHDFDWMAGSWRYANRRLTARGVGSTSWDEFPARSCTSIHLGSVANVDEIEFPTKGWAGLTVRTFDVARQQWAIFWVNSRHGVMTPPVWGGWSGDRGEFYGEDTDDGKPIQVRFEWTRLDDDHAHWQQSFSYDGGATWEVNWMNDLTRTAAADCVDGHPRR